MAGEATSGSRPRTAGVIRASIEYLTMCSLAMTQPSTLLPAATEWNNKLRLMNLKLVATSAFRGQGLLS